MVQDFPVVEVNSTFSLEGSALAFPDMFQLLTFYTLSKDILPIRLRLPHAIQKATDEQQLEDIAQKETEFWSSSMNTVEPASDEQACNSMDAVGSFEQPVCLSKLTFLSDLRKINARDSGISLDDNETETSPRTGEDVASPIRPQGIANEELPKSDDEEYWEKGDDPLPRCIHNSETTRKASDVSEDYYLGNSMNEKSQTWARIPKLRFFFPLLTKKNLFKNRIRKLSTNESSHFGCIVSEYIKQMEGGLEGWTGTGEELLLTVRQLMNQLKIFLVQSNELTPPIESVISSDCIDEMLEDSLESCILKRLHKSLIDALVMEENKESATIMVRNCKVTCDKSMDMKPTGVILGKIEKYLHVMQEASAPSRKVYKLLKMCKAIYKSIDNPQAGADEFLPVLMHVLAHYYTPRLEAEVKYTLHLLNEKLWSGEGAYYLTSVHGAFQLLHNLQEKDAKTFRQSEKCNLRKWQAYQRQLSRQLTVHNKKPQRAFLLVTCGSDPASPVQMIEAGASMSVLEVSQECAQRMRLSSSVASTYGLYIITAAGNLQLLRPTDTIMNIEEMNNRQPHRLLFRQNVLLMCPRPNSLEIPPSNDVTDAREDNQETESSPSEQMTEF
uniref:VPS9 domain-containing protein n=1 Tax=Eptatretus burgeri TaxID=7764 RepID=A0A8C4N3R8_EPTBU